MFCENLVCKYIQKLFTATKNKWKDSCLTNCMDYIMLYLVRVRNFSAENNFHWCYKNGPKVVFQDFYICGTGRIINTRINWLFSRQTKKRTITKSNRSRRKTKSVKNFKPIYYFNISIKSDKHIYISWTYQMFLLRHWAGLKAHQRKTSRWTTEIML